MKNITFSVPEVDVDAARVRAKQEQTTLNEVVRAFLKDYGAHLDGAERARRAMATIDRISQHVRIDRKYTREEMNER